MIEMRWHPVGIWDGKPHAVVDGKPHVLQYRWRDEGSDGYYYWSEWEEVPVCVAAERKEGA